MSLYVYYLLPFTKNVISTNYLYHVQIAEQVNAMAPTIDAELEGIDRRHNELIRVNADLMAGLNLYHQLMREMPVNSLSYYPPPTSMPYGAGMPPSMYPQHAMPAYPPYGMPGMAPQPGMPPMSAASGMPPHMAPPPGMMPMGQQPGPMGQPPPGAPAPMGHQPPAGYIPPGVGHMPAPHGGMPPHSVMGPPGSMAPPHGQMPPPPGSVAPPPGHVAPPPGTAAPPTMGVPMTNGVGAAGTVPDVSEAMNGGPPQHTQVPYMQQPAGGPVVTAVAR